MQRAPTIASFLLFIALCVSLAYWLLQWFAPEPRAVAAPPEAARAIPPVAAASTLFGGRAQDAGAAQVQLRGILSAGRASVAIIAAEGKPPRAVRVNAEVLPGLMVKEIDERTVVLSERGAERELTLPAFAAQEGGTASMQVGTAPEQAAMPSTQQPAPQSSAGASGSGSAAGGPAASTLSPPQVSGGLPPGITPVPSASQSTQLQQQQQQQQQQPQPRQAPPTLR